MRRKLVPKPYTLNSDSGRSFWGLADGLSSQSKRPLHQSYADMFKQRPILSIQNPATRSPYTYLWLVGNGRMVVIVVIIVPHSSIPY